jgi:hypothetical protein
MLRRFVTSVPGSWACQLSSFVARGPKIASGSATPLSSVVVYWMMNVEIEIACGSRSMTQPPENDATDVKRSGWRAA